MDEAGGSSRETDKVSQIEARGNAFGDRARFYMECTVSTEEGRTWRELKDGTDSAASTCPVRTAGWVTPERKHLVGWHEAATSSKRGSRRPLLPEMRRRLERGRSDRRQPRAEAGSQGPAIERDGTIVGMLPKTLTLGFRFTAANNLLVSMARVAEEEWSAPRRTDPDLAEKKLRQFYWTLPSEAESVTLSEIDVAAICGRVIDIPRGAFRPTPRKLTIGIDIGKWMCHWVLVAWRRRYAARRRVWRARGPQRQHGRGAGDPRRPAEVPRRNLRQRLAADRSTGVPDPRHCRPGDDASEPVAVDSGNWESTIVAFCRRAASGSFPPRGSASSSSAAASIAREPGYEVVPQPAGYSLVEINADFWKSWVHARLQTPVGQPGGLTLFHGIGQRAPEFCQAPDRREARGGIHRRPRAGDRWERVNRNNHYLDALALASVAGHGVGERIVEPTPTAPAPQQPPKRKTGANTWAGTPGRWTD
jgi:hypothetical protein